jgi:hypothetical protein
MQYSLEPVVEPERFGKNPRIAHSFVLRDTPVLIAQEWSREVVFNLSGGDLYSHYEDSHSLVFLCVPRERAGVWKYATLGSPVEEFQVVAATWGFQFLWFHFHIC